MEKNQQDLKRAADLLAYAIARMLGTVVAVTVATALRETGGAEPALRDEWVSAADAAGVIGIALSTFEKRAARDPELRRARRRQGRRFGYLKARIVELRDGGYFDQPPKG